MPLSPSLLLSESEEEQPKSVLVIRPPSPMTSDAPDILSLLQRAHLYTNTVSVQHERAPFAAFRAELKDAIEKLGGAA